MYACSTLQVKPLLFKARKVLAIQFTQPSVVADLPHILIFELKSKLTWN